MTLHKFFRVRGEDGYIFVFALLGMLLLASLGILAFTLTTKDMRTSVRLVGEKKAVSAAEAGMYSLIQAFDPTQAVINITGNNACPSLSGYYQVSSSSDKDTCFAFTPPVPPTSGASFFPMGGYSISGGQQWGVVRYTTTITGRNANYTSQVALDVGLGNGPSESSTIYR